MGLFHDRWPWRRDAEGRTIMEVIPRRIRWSLGALLVLGALGGLMIRTAEHDPARWHVDPLTAARSTSPNDAFAASAGVASATVDRSVERRPESPEALMARLAEIALAEPRTTVVAGTPADAHMTFVQRSALFGFPDYVTARAVGGQTGTALAIWSRSRYGYSDMGVNAARIDRWLAKLTR